MIFQNKDKDSILDDLSVPAFKKESEPLRDKNNRSESPDKKLKLLTGEEKYPFRLRDEPVKKNKNKELPSRIKDFNGIILYLNITHNACEEIMNIIHYIADNNIENTALLDRMCKRAMKQIDELIGPHDRKFQEVRYLTPKILDKIRRILLKKLICIYENQNSMVQMISEKNIKHNFESESDMSEGVMMEANVLIGKINKQLIQAQEIYGFFMKNYNYLFRKAHGKDIPEGSSKEGTDSGLEFIQSQYEETDDQGILKINGACEPKIPYLKPFNLERYEKSDPEESESKSSHAGLDGVLTKTLQS